MQIPSTGVNCAAKRVGDGAKGLRRWVQTYWHDLYTRGMDLLHVHKLARGLMDTHGLEQWGLVFDRARKRAGMTKYGDQVISLSQPLMSIYNEKQVRDVILHEIAHARVGSGHRHDEVWKKEARRLGATPRASIKEGPSAPAPYVGRCPNGHEVQRYRLPRGARSCATCSRAFDERYILTWYQRTAA